MCVCMYMYMYIYMNLGQFPKGNPIGIPVGFFIRVLSDEGLYSSKTLDYMYSVI